jgi:hypothetical protein
MKYQETLDELYVGISTWLNVRNFFSSQYEKGYIKRIVDFLGSSKSNFGYSKIALSCMGVSCIPTIIIEVGGNGSWEG